MAVRFNEVVLTLKVVLAKGCADFSSVVGLRSEDNV